MMFISRITQLPRRVKSLIMLVADFCLLPTAFWCAIAIRLGKMHFDLPFMRWVFFLPAIIAVPIFIRCGLYRAVVRYIENRALLTIVSAVTLSMAIFAAVITFLQIPGIPRSSLLIYWSLAVIYIVSSRFLVRELLLWQSTRERKRVIIYGAGNAGRQLAVALKAGPSHKPVAFIDDDIQQCGLSVLGLKVYPVTHLVTLIAQLRVQQIFLAIPSASYNRRIEIVNQLEPFKVEVRILPGMADLLTGQVEAAAAREVDVDELLGRPAVPPQKILLEKNITHQSVLVTGAGGSIGSELCRQILSCRPKVLILFERSEFALYKIENALRIHAQKLGITTEIHGVLGSVMIQARVQNVMEAFAVDTVYHAAAYKHVPIVEYNIAEGVINNCFGMLTAAEAAEAAGVKTFVLISTDKAVRPTNIMGASKRMAELILQAMADKSGQKTHFLMVRFGNVLDSSGSVVPLFRQQIAAGGPVTVTHPDITRYFMTIPEAAQLVIQAGAMGQSGEVFVLDMGEPVKIYELAKRMIHLSGYSVKDTLNPNGDIEIQFSGLRPGEKLYEELLIGESVAATAHPRIMQAQEAKLEKAVLDKMLNRLWQACIRNECDVIVAILCQAVQGFQPEEAMQDILWLKRNLVTTSTSGLNLRFPITYQQTLH
jgi:FlaA1/EpsC-like NDP-sugar epimerase